MSQIRKKRPDKLLEAEAKAFDRYAEERTGLGQVPDLRRLAYVDGLYNNAWREPAFVEIQIMPKVKFIIDIARKTGGRVLELGCGTGYLALELARNGLEVDAVDISKKSIKVARKYAAENTYKKNFGSLRYRVDDITTVKLGDSKYDSIISFGTLHHLPGFERMIARIYNALKTGGNLIMGEPIIDNFSRQSAVFAATLRAVLPTWRPYEEKLAEIATDKDWGNYVESIFNEYRRVSEKGEALQSPSDNAVSSETAFLEPVKKLFKIKRIKYEDAFIDRIIGGLRGEHGVLLARFLKLLDNQLIKEGYLKPTYILVQAVKP